MLGSRDGLGALDEVVEGSAWADRCLDDKVKSVAMKHTRPALTNAVRTCPGCGTRGGVDRIPLWAVALALAAVAPWCVRAFSKALEHRVRRRTLDTIARARAADGRTRPVPLEGGADGTE